MNLHHKNCGGKIKEGELREYNFGGDENYGWIPDLFCEKCGHEIIGDRQIAESIDDLQMGTYEIQNK